MSDKCLYPREPPRTRDPYRLADWIAAALVAAFVLVVNVGAAIQGQLTGLAIPMAVGLAPCFLLLIPRVWSMAIVAFMGIPCCFGSSMYCDGSSVQGFPGAVLHTGHDWVWLISLYGLIRLVMIARTKNVD